MKKPETLVAKIVLCVIAMEVLGGLGAFFTAGSITDWYATLKRPPGTPPNWLFGPVWSLLYALIGISFAIVWQRGEACRCWRIFFVQLALNLAWTPIFFGAHLLLVALIVILVLLAAIGFTIRCFASVSKPAAWLLVPYAIWVAYASYLNAGYAFLN